MGTSPSTLPPAPTVRSRAPNVAGGASDGSTCCSVVSKVEAAARNEVTLVMATAIPAEVSVAMSHTK